MFDKHLNVSVLSVLTVLLGMFLVSLVGCEPSPPIPSSQPKIQKTEPPAPEEKAEEEESEEEEPKPALTFEPPLTNRREPFKTLIAEEIPDVEDVVILVTPTVIETPLQKFPIDQLQIRGIILGGLGDYARITAPDGKSYTISIGTLVGNQEGKVTSITENAIIVKEIVRYESGKSEEIETPLYLIPIEQKE